MSMSSPGRRLAVLVGLFFLNGVAWRGGKLLVALGALSLGASPFLVGALAAVYAVLPMLLSIHTGRIVDRIGARPPVLAGAAVMALSFAFPVVSMTFASLLACTVLLGLGQLLIQISVHNSVGAMSGPGTRSGNFATLQVGASVAGLVGPLAVGAAIDGFGLPSGFALVSACAVAIPAILFAPALSAGRRPDAQPVRERAVDLLAHPELRRTLFTSAAAMCGLELFAFYLPVHGAAIGLSATVIGGILAARAAAALVIRIVIRPVLNRFGERAVLSASLIPGAAGLAVLPMFQSVGVLFAVSFFLGLGMGVAAPLTRR